MSTESDLIKRRSTVKTSINKLGGALDLAEQAANAADARGDDASHYDFTADDGSLAHRSERCPYCRLETARAEYLGALRDTAVARRDALLEWSLPDEAWSHRVARVDHCRKQRREMRAAYATARSAREQCDAAAKLERAESDFELIFRKTVSGIGRRAIRHISSKWRDKLCAAMTRLDLIEKTGTPAQVRAARQRLADLTLEAGLIGFAQSNMHARIQVRHEQRQAELRDEWDRKMAPSRAYFAQLREETKRFLASREQG